MGSKPLEGLYVCNSDFFRGINPSLVCKAHLKMGFFYVKAFFKTLPQCYTQQKVPNR